MTQTISSRLIVLGLLAAFFFVAVSVTQANHSWGKYHWNLSTADTVVAPLKLGNNLTTAEWNASLVDSTVDWNTASPLISAITPGNTNPAECNPTLGQVEVCNASYGENGWLGIAQVWAYRGRDGHIAQATVLVNDTYFNRPSYNTAAWRQMVMCQEVGHTFGLGHQDEGFTNTNLGTCMDYTSDPLRDDGFGNNLHPNAHDFEMLTSIYAHLNETSSDGGGKPDKGDGGGKGGGKGKPADTALERADWGTAVAADAAGRDNLFVAERGGFEVITHVLWEPATETEHTH